MQEAMPMPTMEMQTDTAVAGLGILVFVAIFLVLGLVHVIPFFFIFKKVGWHWALGFLMLISPVNLILLYVMAFAKWPIEKRLQQTATAALAQANFAPQSVLALF